MRMQPSPLAAEHAPAHPPADLVAMLQADHAEIRRLFDRYEGLMAEGAAHPARQELAARICLALAMHATLEEEFVYPVTSTLHACRRANAEAAVEHAAALELVNEITELEPDDPAFDAHVSVLAKHMRQHLDEEEELLLPDLVRARKDLRALGRQAHQRRQALLGELDALDTDD
jgi:Hemerythrin HHE cation binding domain